METRPAAIDRHQRAAGNAPSARRLTAGSVPGKEARGGQAQALQHQFEGALVVEQPGFEGAVADIGHARGLEDGGRVGQGVIALDAAGVQPHLRRARAAGGAGERRRSDRGGQRRAVGKGGWWEWELPSYTPNAPVTPKPGALKAQERRQRGARGEGERAQGSACLSCCFCPLPLLLRKPPPPAHQVNGLRPQARD
jgi:hypothetical protein